MCKKGIFTIKRQIYLADNQLKKEISRGSKRNTSLLLYVFSYVFSVLSEKCFKGKPEDRSSFSGVVELIKKELSEEEIIKYKTMNDIYSSNLSKYS